MFLTILEGHEHLYNSIDFVTYLPTLGKINNPKSFTL